MACEKLDGQRYLQYSTIGRVTFVQKKLTIPDEEFDKAVWLARDHLITLYEAMSTGQLAKIIGELQEASDDLWYELLRLRYTDIDSHRGVMFMSIGFFTYHQLLGMMTNRDSKAGRQWFAGEKQTLLFFLGQVLAQTSPTNP